MSCDACFGSWLVNVILIFIQLNLYEGFKRRLTQTDVPVSSTRSSPIPRYVPDHSELDSPLSDKTYGEYGSALAWVQFDTCWSSSTPEWWVKYCLFDSLLTTYDRLLTCGLLVFVSTHIVDNERSPQLWCHSHVFPQHALPVITQILLLYSLTTIIILTFCSMLFYMYMYTYQ